jgi:hypothetical protein
MPIFETSYRSETQQKAETWLKDVRSSQRDAADRKAVSEYMGTIDDLNDPAIERVFPQGVIDEGTERFLSTLESMAWSEHIQALLASQQDRRIDFQEKTGADIAGEQFATLREVLDTPGFYSS